jgi:hypothetical protein
MKYIESFDYLNLREEIESIFIDNDAKANLIRPINYDILLKNFGRNNDNINIILEKYKNDKFHSFKIDKELIDNIFRLNRLMDGYKPYFFIKSQEDFAIEVLIEDDYTVRPPNVKRDSEGFLFYNHYTNVYRLQITYKKII